MVNKVLAARIRAAQRDVLGLWPTVLSKWLADEAGMDAVAAADQVLREASDETAWCWTHHIEATADGCPLRRGDGHDCDIRSALLVDPSWLAGGDR